MKKTSIALLLSAAFTANVFAQNIATVNGQAIPIAREQVILEQIQRTSPGMNVSSAQIRDNLISQEVLSQEAIKLGLDQTQTYREQVELTRRTFLVSALYDDFSKKNTISDQEIQAEYDKMKALLSTEYQSRHILVESEEDAKAIIVQLNQGAKFSELAATHSIDTGTAKEGGLLDWSVSAVYVPEFAQALENMKKGEILATPVKTQYGWHVIKLEDIRNAQMSDFPPLNDAIKTQLRTQLEEKSFMEYQEDLIRKAQITRVE